MHGAPPLLLDLAIVLCVAAVTTVLFRRLRQPVVLGYLLAGIIVGPHTPVPLFADAKPLHTLSELGVILVMFSVGLDFSVRKLARVLPTSGVIGLVQVTTMMWLGYQTGQLFGWTTLESVFTGAIVAISSTMVVAKVFAERRVTKDLSDTVFGVLVVQDLAAILLLALLTAVASGRGSTTDVLTRTAAELWAFLAAIAIVGFLVVPRSIRAIVKLKSPETLLVASVGICFAMALGAASLGFSVALGAFLAGSLVAESGEAERVEALVRSVRDIFAAIFFVVVGMLLDPALLLEHWPAVLVLSLVVVVGQIASVSIGALISGRDLKTAIQTGMSLAQIGEFSFILASIGIASGVVRGFLYPVTIAVAIVTTFTTPWLIRGSIPAASWIDRRLPRRMQTLLSLYSSWVEQAGTPSHAEQPGTRKRLVSLLGLDALFLGGIVVGVGLSMDLLLGYLSSHYHIRPRIGLWIVLLAAMVIGSPFFFGIVRIAQRLGARLADAALPPSEPGAADRNAVPRRALIVSLQLIVALLVTLPLLALAQPFMPAAYGIGFLVVLLMLLGIGFWRGTANLEEHVRTGAQMIADSLQKQVASDNPTLDGVHPLLPGFGPLTPVKLEAASPAIGKTLAQINLRALSGASVIAIMRGKRGLEPTGKEELKEGDVLAIAGTHRAISSAVDMLRAGPASLVE